jgi:hypothetical protein
MKTAVLLILLAQDKRLLRETMPADIDAAKEARMSEKLVLSNEILRVMEVRVPAGVKELHFAPEKTGFFVIGGERVIWQDGPVILRGDAIHVEFVKRLVASTRPTKEGVLFENSLVRATKTAMREGDRVEWLAKEKVLILRGLGKDKSGAMRIEVKF